MIYKNILTSTVLSARRAQAITNCQAATNSLQNLLTVTNRYKQAQTGTLARTQYLWIATDSHSANSCKQLRTQKLATTSTVANTGAWQHTITNSYEQLLTWQLRTVTNSYGQLLTATNSYKQLWTVINSYEQSQTAMNSYLLSAMNSYKRFKGQIVIKSYKHWVINIYEQSCLAAYKRYERLRTVTNIHQKLWTVINSYERINS